MQYPIRRAIRSDYTGHARKEMSRALVSLRAKDAVVTSGAVSSWPNSGSGGSAYDLDTYQGTAGAIRKQPANSLLLDGVTGSYVSTPDSPANSVTGDCILFGYVEPVDNTPVGQYTIFGKNSPTGDQRGYIFTLDNTPTSGGFQLNLSASGTTSTAYESTEATGVADGIGYWPFAVIDIGNEVTFWVSLSPPTVTPDVAFANATQVGTAVPVALTEIFNSSAPLEIGAFNSGTVPLNGLIHRAGIIAGLDPTATPSVDFNPTAKGNLSGTDSAKFFGAEMLKPSARVINATDWFRAGDGVITNNGDGTVALDDTDTDVNQTVFYVTSAGSPTGGGSNLLDITLSQGTSTQTSILVRYTGGGNPAPYDGISIDWADPLNPTANNATVTVADVGDGAYRYLLTTTENGSVATGVQPQIFPAGEAAGETGSVIVHGEVSLQSEWTLHGNARISDHDTVQDMGGAYLETTVAPAILSTPFTRYTVAKNNALTGVAQKLAAARADAANSVEIGISAAGNFTADAGATLTAGAADTAVHLHTLRDNGDGTSSYEVSGIGIATGSVGTEGLEFGTAFGNVGGTETWGGSMARDEIIPGKVNGLANKFIQQQIMRLDKI